MKMRNKIFPFSSRYFSISLDDSIAIYQKQRKNERWVESSEKAFEMFLSSVEHCLILKLINANMKKKFVPIVSLLPPSFDRRSFPFSIPSAPFKVKSEWN